MVKSNDLLKKLAAYNHSFIGSNKHHNFQPADYQYTNK